MPAYLITLHASYKETGETGISHFITHLYNYKLQVYNAISYIYIFQVICETSKVEIDCFYKMSAKTIYMKLSHLHSGFT